VVKRLRIVEVLPLNQNIHRSLINKESIEIMKENLKLRLPSEIIAEVNEKDNTEFPLCEHHDERYKHFFCKQEGRIYCRACLEDNYPSSNYHIVDLYLLKPELVNYILSNISKNFVTYEDEDEENEQPNYMEYEDNEDEEYFNEECNGSDDE
jgi:hypothetical protein